MIGDMDDVVDALERVVELAGEASDLVGDVSAYLAANDDDVTARNCLGETRLAGYYADRVRERAESVIVIAERRTR